MSITHQQINEILAKGIGKTSDEIKKADAFLKSKKGNKPTWLDEFLSANRNKMVETICRTTREQKMASTSGYNEGYFNEIIQNANDLHCGSTIEITVGKNGDLYSVACKYKDKGFSVSNIYGFLNREMSDKSAESGQSGKFGIGIKSLFSFIQKLTVTSNVLFDFSIEHKNDEFNVEGDVKLNETWDKKNTILTFVYDSNVETDFNIQKLTKLIDFLCGDEDGKVNEFFWADDMCAMIFDIRSLIFMNAVDNDTKYAISEITFKYENNEISLKFILNGSFVKDGKVVEKVSLHLEDESDLFEQDFLLVKTPNISIAYPLDSEMVDCNRHYSTYFIRNDEKGRILPTSALIHSSKYVNMHRTDFGNNESDIDNNFKKLAEDVRDIFEFMCSKDCGNIQLSVDISNVFHKLLLRYLEKDQSFIESPFAIDGLTTQHLPKIQNGVCRRFVVDRGGGS